MSSNRSVLVSSLLLLVAIFVLVLVELGQSRSLNQALRLGEELRRSYAALQASVERLEAAAPGLVSAAAAQREGSRVSQAEAASPVEVQDGAAQQAHLAALAQRNREQHAQDAARYSEDLLILYRQALEEKGTESRESNQAFGALVEKYPDANAAGMAIANRGLQAAMKQRTAEVEMFRNMLTRKEHFKGIVTDSHIDAYPALCGFLANRYMADGRQAEAEALLGELTKNYARRYVAIGGFGSKPMLVPVERFAERVRTEARGEHPPQPPQRGLGG